MIYKSEYAVVFDLDGVIINSRNVQIEALEKSYYDFYREGEPPIEDFFRLSGSRLEEIFDILNLPAKMCNLYRHYSIQFMDRIKLYGGMTSVLEYLQENKVKIGLCTGKDNVRTLQILQKFDIYKYFNAVVCSDEVREPKPCNESLLKCLDLVGLDTSQAVMVGDGINDILCAKNANVKSIAVMWGDGKAQELINQKPDFLANDVDMLVDILKNLVI